MSGPLKYDLIIGLLFLAAAGIGARFGFFKLFLIVLALLVPGIIDGLLFLTLGKEQVFSFVFSGRSSLLFGFSIAKFILPLALLIWIIARVPRAHSALSRASGALFAVVLVGFVAVIGSVMTDTIIGLREVRAKSLTGPVIFALGDRLMPLLQDNSNDFFGKFGKPVKAEQQ